MRFYYVKFSSSLWTSGRRNKRQRWKTKLFHHWAWTLEQHRLCHVLRTLILTDVLARWTLLVTTCLFYAHHQHVQKQLICLFDSTLQQLKVFVKQELAESFGLVQHTWRNTCLWFLHNHVCIKIPCIKSADSTHSLAPALCDEYFLFMYSWNKHYTETKMPLNTQLLQ